MVVILFKTECVKESPYRFRSNPANTNVFSL